MTGRRPVVSRPPGLPGWFVAAVALPPTAFLALFYAWPFGAILARGLRGAGGVLARSRTWEVVWFTTWQAVASTVLTLLAGIPGAWAVARFEFPGRRALLALLTAVFVLPTVVLGAAFVALLPAGHARGAWAILGAHLVFNLAVVVRVVGSAWEQLPRAVEEAAASLGATGWQTFRHVTLPVLASALWSAATIVFLFCFTSFGVVRVLGTVRTATVEVEVWRRATQLGDLGGATALTLLQLAALGAVVLVSTRLQGRRALALDLDPHARRLAPRGRQRAWVWSAAGATALVAAAPLAALAERSRPGWRYLGRTEIRPGLSLGIDPLDALRQSLVTALVATALTVVVGALASVAVTVARRGGSLLDVGMTLPLATSAVTVGFGMLITFDTPPVDWRAEWWLVPVGHALVAAPFVVRSCVGVLRQVDPALREAATILGASRVRAWATATLPHLWRPLASGAGFAAAVSLGEFGATSFLSRSGRETLPIAIERLLGRTGQSFQAQAFALSAVLAAATIAVVATTDALTRRTAAHGR